MTERVTIQLTGPQGSGKTVLANFIVRKLAHFGVACEHTKGGDPRGPDHDTLVVHTTREALAKIAEEDRR